MSKFQLSLMPEEKMVGSQSKWIDVEIIQGRRKDIAKECERKYYRGTWRLRVISE